MYYNNVRLASGDTGAKPEGFVDSLESVFPIIGNQTVTLKNTKPLSVEGNKLFDSNGKLVNLANTTCPNKAAENYKNNGTFSATMTRGTCSVYHENNFSFQYPMPLT